MPTLNDVCDWTLEVIEEERNYSKCLDAQQRELRLRKIREIELTSRLRHAIGGLDTFMSGKGADIRSESLGVEIQVKFPNYWTKRGNRPQPISLKEIEKDVGTWLSGAGDVPRFCVIFMPQTRMGHGVEGKKRAHSEGRRICKDCFSGHDYSFEARPYAAALHAILSESVNHKNKRGSTSVYRQYRESDIFASSSADPFALRSVGVPSLDLVWGLVLEPRRERPAAAKVS